MPSGSRQSYPNNSYDPYWGGRQYPDRSYNPYHPFDRRPQVYESIKPPAPRKVETPSTATIVVIGDSLGEWLGYGLEQAFAETPEIGIVRKIKPDLDGVAITDDVSRCCCPTVGLRELTTIRAGGEDAARVSEILQ